MADGVHWGGDGEVVEEGDDVGAHGFEAVEVGVFRR